MRQGRLSRFVIGFAFSTASACVSAHTQEKPAAQEKPLSQPVVQESPAMFLWTIRLEGADAITIQMHEPGEEGKEQMVMEMKGKKGRS